MLVEVDALDVVEDTVIVVSVALDTELVAVLEPLETVTVTV